MKINFKANLILFSIFEFMLCWSLKTHSHCCSTHCGMKPINPLSSSESTVKARRLIWTLSLMITKSLGMRCRLTCTDSRKKCTIQKKDRTSKTLEGLQLCNSFAVRIHGRSLLTVIKYSRLKPKFI